MQFFPSNLSKFSEDDYNVPARKPGADAAVRN